MTWFAVTVSAEIFPRFTQISNPGDSSLAYNFTHTYTQLFGTSDSWNFTPYLTFTKKLD